MEYGYGIEERLVRYINPISKEMGRRYRSAVIVCPGGGYSRWTEREAEQVALRYQAYGMQAFVFRYPLKKRFPQAMHALAEVVAYIRSHAEQWDIDKDNIYGVGFSAGGHLVASLGCYGSEQLSMELGLQESCVLNGMILCYPVISGDEWGHEESIHNLTDGNTELIETVSLEKQVSERTPATFMWHCYDDVEVDVNNTLEFVRILRKNNISCECHIFETGGHGISLCDATTAEIEGQILPEVEQWFPMSLQWIQRQNTKRKLCIVQVQDKLKRSVEAIRQSQYIADDIIEFMISENKKYVYGNGLQVCECLRIFREMGVAIEGIILPPGSEKCSFDGYWGELMSRINAYSLNDIVSAHEKVDILLAIDSSEYDFVRRIMEMIGCKGVYTCCWERNIYMKQICNSVGKDKVGVNLRD